MPRDEKIQALARELTWEDWVAARTGNVDGWYDDGSGEAFYCHLPSGISVLSEELAELHEYVRELASGPHGSELLAESTGDFPEMVHLGLLRRVGVGYELEDLGRVVLHERRQKDARPHRAAPSSTKTVSTSLR